MLLSIIVPCYNEDAALPVFYNEMNHITHLLPSDIEIEYIFIDDGSTDNTLNEIKQLRSQNEQVHFISFSRNFGKEAGLYAGLTAARGELIVVMDVDLQDPPTLLPEMIETVLGGQYECVAARRVNRKGEPKIRSLFARLFYKLINRISDIELVDGARDFRVLTRPMVNALLQYQEVNRFSKGLFAIVGFRTKWLEYENIERTKGETKWSFWKLFLYSIECITSFSTAPLAATSFIGFFVCVAAIILALFYGIKAIILGDPAAGFPTLVVITLFVGGLQLFCLGITGQYLARVYLETKKRPLYIVREEE